MSLTSALNSAMSGLRSNARVTELISENIANALTPGYARREVVLTSGGDLNPGVRIEGVRDLGDPAMVSFRREAETDLGHAGTLATFFKRVETAIGMPGSGDGLGDLMTRLETTLIAARSMPESETRLSAVVAAASELAHRINKTYEDLGAERASAEAKIASSTGELNDALKEVHALNARISDSLSRKVDASGLQLRRKEVIDRINDLVPVREVARDFGKIALYTQTGHTLLDGPAAAVSFSRVPSINETMSVETGTLARLEINGTAIDGRVVGGEIGAYFEIRDAAAPGYQSQLNNLARDLIDRVVIEGTEGPPLHPTTLFEPYEALVAGSDIAGLAERLKINPLVSKEDGGSPFHIRDGLAGGDPGDVSRLDNILRGLTEGTGPSGRTIFSQVESLVADIGTSRVRSEDEQTRHAARLDHARRAEAQTGVDTDAELQHLLEVEKAYAANARVIETITSLFDDLLRI